MTILIQIHIYAFSAIKYEYYERVEHKINLTDNQYITSKCDLISGPPSGRQACS